MWCEPWKEGCALTLKVTPRASRDAVLGAEEGWLRLALTAPPVDGKANEAARRFLAEALALPKGAIRLLSGQTARLKRFHIPLPPETVRETLTKR